MEDSNEFFDEETIKKIITLSKNNSVCRAKNGDRWWTSKAFLKRFGMELDTEVMYYQNLALYRHAEVKRAIDTDDETIWIVEGEIVFDPNCDPKECDRPFSIMRGNPPILISD